MAFDGSLLTHPTTGTEQPIADALVLSYTGVYASPVAPAFSPNGDGVGDKQALSYRLVRPSTVTATLNGPNGTTITLPGGAQSPGTYPLSWDGRNGSTPAPAGAWTFSVSATDDRSVTTTAHRSFVLDDTLGFLTVGRAGRGETAHFVLSRQANVVVRIERTNGKAVATSHLNGLAAGSHKFTWNRRIGAKRAPKGRYLLKADATSSIGTSSLVAPFTLK
jgi:flagellar hook assembly protein FlgD